LTAAHAHQLARNSFEASFATAEQKQAWLSQLDECFVQFGA